MGPEAAAIQHVADRYLCRLAAQEACLSTGVRLASAGLTPEVVAAFAEHFYLPQHEGRVAFGGLVRKLKQLVEGFKHLPRLWDKFKKVIGIESLADIPKAIMSLASTAKKAIKQVLHKMFDTWPLKIYTLEKGKLASFNQMLDKLIGKSPKLKRALDSAIRAVGSFGETVRQHAPHIMGAVMVAVYIWVWLNVVEFEWDLKALVDAISGGMTFPDFLSSLPGSAFGFLLNSFGFGTFTLLPLTLVARLMYLLGHRYVEWTGSGFKVDWGKIKADFDVDSAGLPVPS